VISRPRLVAALAVAATLAVAAPASAAQRSYAYFRVMVSGSQTTQATGSVTCDQDGGTVVPASATDTATFATHRARTLLFARAHGVVSVFTRSGLAGSPTVIARGTDVSQSGFGGSPEAAACPSGTPAPGCGTTALRRIVLLVQGGSNEVSIQARSVTPRHDCLVPASFAFPELVGTEDDGTGAHVHYSAHVPAALLNPRRHVIVIHGRATATSHDVGQGQSTGTSTLRFTMRLTRVR
jgi:hypothetical protein